MISIVINISIILINAIIAYIRFKTKMVNLKYADIVQKLEIHFMMQWVLLIVSIVNGIRAINLSENTINSTFIVIINLVSVVLYLEIKHKIRKSNKNKE